MLSKKDIKEIEKEFKVCNHGKSLKSFQNLLPIDEREVEDLLTLLLTVALEKHKFFQVSDLAHTISSKFGTKKIEIPSAGEIEKALKNIPSTRYPVSKIYGKKYYYMNKKEIAEIVHNLLLERSKIRK